MRAAVDMTGQRVGRLTILRRAPCANTKGARWLCRCDCGAETSVLRTNLKNAGTASCGCRRLEPRTHGHAHRGRQSKLYRTWCNIIARCCNERVPAYRDYGARGIGMSAAWRESFEAFAAEVGEPASESLSIDRIDNDRGYEPGNVRWADAKQQANNRRTRRTAC
ncbi:MAG: hypothetical protein H0X11_04490 [Betaproteobacteria bacterium]|nr:hypothetical protein [Betaproteobacteria bacterium]